MAKKRQSYTDLTSLVLRLGLGLMMIFGHGLGKLQTLISGEVEFVSLFSLPPEVNLTLAMLAEFLASIFVVVGFKTRWASIPVIITMFIAAFVVHAQDAFFMMKAAGDGSKEFAMLYLVGFLAIALIGSGKYSLDYVTQKQK